MTDRREGIFVFVGPTIDVEEARKLLDATYLPPVGQGDIYRASRERPFAIGIIDGYFERVPAVWHKEILWALAQGIHVLGSSSMGALRAAELAVYGMRGLGRVFESFASGELQDDDEVAVAHASAEDRYRAMSVALVNIRATLRRATCTNAISVETEAELITIAKGLFYPDRVYPALVDQARKRGVNSEEIDALVGFLETGRVDQKREDAVLLLQHLSELRSRGAPPGRGARVEQTAAFVELRRWAEGLPPFAALKETAAAVTARHVAAELRLDPAAAAPVIRAALARAEADASMRSRGNSSQTASAGRKSNGADRAWQLANDLEGHGLEAFLQREEHLRRVQRRHLPSLDLYIADELRALGQYERLRDRAKKKSVVLARLGLTNPSLDDVKCTEAELFAWYFDECVGAAVPPDLAAYSESIGLTNQEELLREAARERAYSIHRM